MMREKRRRHDAGSARALALGALVLDQLDDAPQISSAGQ